MVGTVVGSYRIVRELGSGGMGRVYLGEHITIGKRAAIKVLLPSVSTNAEIVTRFFNEARASSRLKHVGIVDVYDFGQLDDGSAYIVMELCEGESLTALIERHGRLEANVVVDLARQVASALAVAHANGIVHRDLKPDNVILVPDAEMRSGVRAKILDFGIAKLTEVEGAPVNATRTGTIMGTPVYMSPEQCRGAGQVDHRTDIYALGCVMFEMATGAPPFCAEWVGDLIAAHLTQAPQSLTGVLPSPYDALVARMLAKHVDDRVQTMQEVASQLRAPSQNTGVPIPQRVTLLQPKLSRTTTLAEANGQVSASQLPSTRTSRGSALTIAGVAVVGIVGGLIAVSRVHDKPVAPHVVATPAPLVAPAAVAITPPLPLPAPTVAPKSVAIVVASQPAGADVYRVADGVRVGKTPWTSDFARSEGEAVFTLRMKGYRNAEVAVQLDHDATSTTMLEKSAARRSANKRMSKDGVVDPFQ